MSVTTIPDHDPDDPAPSRVFVNGSRIPVGDIRLYMRKEGPLAFTRYCEGEFASPHDGVDWINAFDGFTPSQQDDYDTLRVDVRDRATGDYYLNFRGIVTGVGNSPEDGSRWFQFRAQGPAMLLNDIPASITFDNTSLRFALSYIASEIEERVPFSVTEVTQADGEVREGETVEPPSNFIYDQAGFAVGRALADQLGLETNTPRTFTFGSDTLADVADWISEKANIYLWLSPTEEGVALVANRQPADRLHTAHYLDGDLHVEDNDALSELRPVNTMLVKAPAAKSRGGETTKAAGKYVEAKAVHQPLFRRAGERELYADTHRLSDAHTVVEARNEARRKLKKAVDQARGGDMTTLLRGNVTPFDFVEAKPTCDGQDGSDTVPLTYEVARVKHEIHAEGIPETTLNVGVKTDPVEDITVFDSWDQSP